MTYEAQSSRIERLGESEIWYGQSSFCPPGETPALEEVIVPSRYEGTCAGCGQPFEAPVWGTMVCAFNVVVLHLGQGRYEVYHPGCQPPDVRFVPGQAVLQFVPKAGPALGQAQESGSGQGRLPGL